MNDESIQRLQDSVVLLVGKGFELRVLLWMDLFAFRSLLSSQRRIDCQERVANIWAIYAGAQSSHESVTDYVSKILNPDKNDSDKLADKLTQGNRNG